MALLNCIVVDDDEASRLIISKYIEKTDFLDLTDTFDNAIDASNLLLGNSNNNVDLIFLDIEMPEMSGLDLARSLNGTHPIIFITSQKEYALEAFEGNTLDYLVKPPEYGRFLKAAQKAKEQHENIIKSAETENYIFVKSESRYVRVNFDDLLYIEALADYVIFHTVKSKYVVHHTMKGIEKRLPISIFSRVHRSFIVNRTKINQIEDINVYVSDSKIPIGAYYREKFLNKLNIL
ncbi:MAG: LytR/AlgR family response regulator transcription factor [Bacteroidota bacterium]